MTKFEMELLDLLREDCRLPLEKLAIMLGSTTDVVAETIDRLEEQRIILHYAPTINWDKTDRERVEAPCRHTFYRLVKFISATLHALLSY